LSKTPPHVLTENWCQKWHWQWIPCVGNTILANLSLICEHDVRQNL